MLVLAIISTILLGMVAMLFLLGVFAGEDIQTTIASVLMELSMGFVITAIWLLYCRG